MYVCMYACMSSFFEIMNSLQIGDDDNDDDYDDYDDYDSEEEEEEEK